MAWMLDGCAMRQARCPHAEPSGPWAPGGARNLTSRLPSRLITYMVPWPAPLPNGPNSTQPNYGAAKPPNHLNVAGQAGRESWRSIFPLGGGPWRALLFKLSGGQTASRPTWRPISCAPMTFLMTLDCVLSSFLGCLGSWEAAWSWSCRDVNGRVMHGSRHGACPLSNMSSAPITGQQSYSGLLSWWRARCGVKRGVGRVPPIDYRQNALHRKSAYKRSLQGMETTCTLSCLQQLRG